MLLRNDGDALPLKIGSKVAVVGPQSTARSGLLSDYAGGQWCYGPSNKHPWSSQEYCIPSIAEGIAAANTGGETNVAAGVSTCTTNQVSPKCKQSVSEWNSSTAAGGIASALQNAKAADAVVVVLGIDKSVEREGTDRYCATVEGRRPLLLWPFSTVTEPSPGLLVPLSGIRAPRRREQRKKRRKNEQKWARYGLRKRVRAAVL